MAAENAKEQPNPSGGESPINSAPPVPGQENTQVGQEQPIQPAPAIPTNVSQQSNAVPQERPIAPAPTVPMNGSPEQKIAGPGAIPTSRPSSGPAAERPLASAPQVPMSGTQQAKPAGSVPMTGQPPMGGQIPMPGQPQMAGPMPSAGPFPSAEPQQQPGAVWGETPLAQAPTAGAPIANQPAQPAHPGYTQPMYGAGQSYPAGPSGVQGEIPMANPAMNQGMGYPAPMAPANPTGMPNPGWGQPPSNPPPVPPPSEPQAPHQQAAPFGNMAGQPQSGEAGAAGTPMVSGDKASRNAKSRTARTLRRRSQERSSYFAMMFLFGAALFLIGVVIVLVVSLM